MINLYDIIYGFGLGAGAPYWLIKSDLRKKVLRALSQRTGHVDVRKGDAPAILIHAVSLGEINATRALIELLRKMKPGLQFIVSVTTETGFARGREIYGSAGDVMLVRYPLDFSGSIERFLDALRPSIVVLIELEVWPNFIARCRRRGIPVLLINGRITKDSFHKYKMAKPLVSGMFRRLEAVGAQDSTYAERFIVLGSLADRVQVTGTMKFDNAEILDRIPGQEELAAACGLRPDQERIWVCGSTGPGEEQIILDEYRLLLKRFPTLRLVIVPRKPERFDEVGRMIATAGFPLMRRSRGQVLATGALPVVVLGDTMGELRKFYSLAEVVLVGRTLVDLGARQHGSDMIEPAALAKPVAVGIFTGNFAEAMQKFCLTDAIKIVLSSAALGETMAVLLDDPAASREMGKRAREVVRREQGATARHAEMILNSLPEPVSAIVSTNR